MSAGCSMNKLELPKNTTSVFREKAQPKPQCCPGFVKGYSSHTINYCVFTFVFEFVHVFHLLFIKGIYPAIHKRKQISHEISTNTHLQTLQHLIVTMNLDSLLYITQPYFMSVHHK